MSTSSWPRPALVGADAIAAALGMPAPTDQQRAVIESGPAPALVVAGAGSGKTETMAGRVVWLVANEHVRADQVLGLTFTRKAAGELGERIGRRLAAIDEYARRGLVPRLNDLHARGVFAEFWSAQAERSSAERARAWRAFLDELQIREETPAQERDPADALLLRPDVATYNAFADGIVREHGARIGRDSDAVLLSPSGSWLLARRVVLDADDPRLPEREEALSTIVDAVQRLSGEMLDNRVDAAALRDVAQSWGRRWDTVRCRLKTQQARVDTAKKNLGALRLLTDLVEQYTARKSAEGTLDFADQVAGALQIVEHSPQVAEELREHYPVVLLDEYQDTSVIQTDLLATVFSGAAVMAVGDPQQSIYGWRGASAENLAAFSSAFARGAASESYALTTSWRNDRAILTAANALLSGAATSGVPVAELAARPGAGDGDVQARFATSVEDEADQVAGWFAEGRRRAPEGTVPPSGAVLFRTKRQMTVFADALDRAGVPNRILGLGGLLATPEVLDVVCALRVIHDPQQGSALLRLLSGPRFAIGVADLAALHDLARMLADTGGSLASADPAIRARLRASAGADEQASIIDAIDVLRRTGSDHGLWERFSPTARPRLREAAEMFDRLRAAAAQPIPDLIRQIEVELRLDIELAANEARGPARTASSGLRSFVDEVRAFLLADDRGSLGSLLAWLAHAEETDELMPRPEPPEPGVVQLLTVHGAKGLEWDQVAVVRLVEREFPKDPRTVNGWFGFGVLPYPLRGDRDALPTLEWGIDDPDDELAPALEEFRERDRDRQLAEERRLAYVAVTRARHELLLSGAWWAGQKQPRAASTYLAEMLEALGQPPLDEADPGENPYQPGQGRVEHWPLDPLGARGPRVRAAADAVYAAQAGSPVADPTVVRLLEEREERARHTPSGSPLRIPASKFKDYLGDYEAAVARVSRPLPERPFRRTRIGTLFHAWVERRSELAGTGVSPGDALWEMDEEDPAGPEDESAELSALQDAFERSEWASLRPLEVESEIDFALGSGPDRRVMVCKLDAVYLRGDRYEIVDWKTGRSARTDAERADRLLQLALYRVAFHKARGIPLDRIDVTLFYVAEGVVVRESEVYSEEELVQRWNAARDARSASRASASGSGSGSVSEASTSTTEIGSVGGPV